MARAKPLFMTVMEISQFYAVDVRDVESVVAGLKPGGFKYSKTNTLYQRYDAEKALRQGGYIV